MVSWYCYYDYTNSNSIDSFFSIFAINKILSIWLYSFTYSNRYDIFHNTSTFFLCKLQRSQRIIKLSQTWITHEMYGRQKQQVVIHVWWGRSFQVYMNWRRNTISFMLFLVYLPLLNTFEHNSSMEYIMLLLIYIFNLLTIRPQILLYFNVIVDWFSS